MPRRPARRDPWHPLTVESRTPVTGRRTKGMTGRKQSDSLLVSEPITPCANTFNATRAGRGEPGLPCGFSWRGRTFSVLAELGAWKQSSREGGTARGYLYLRRHYYRLRMSDSSIWTVYFLRQSPRSGNPKHRWFLYTLET